MKKYLKISLMLAIVMGLGHLSMIANSTNCVGMTTKTKTCTQFDNENHFKENEQMQAQVQSFFGRVSAVGRAVFQHVTKQIFYANKPKNWKQGTNPQDILVLMHEDLSKFDK